VVCYLDKVLSTAAFGEDSILHRVADTTLLHVTSHRSHVLADVTIHVMSQAEEL